ncbi:hypothetical protein BC830DRAFT_858767 [Chytriomyces sp. MP71]|nr:hypothetical protein BC830DRAFT_858767 [Chytriomyces sp. MP71]
MNSVKHSVSTTPSRIPLPTRRLKQTLIVPSRIPVPIRKHYLTARGPKLAAASESSTIQCPHFLPVDANAYLSKSTKFSIRRAPPMNAINPAIKAEMPSPIIKSRSTSAATSSSSSEPETRFLDPIAEHRVEIEAKNLRIAELETLVEQFESRCASCTSRSDDLAQDRRIAELEALGQQMAEHHANAQNILADNCFRMKVLQQTIQELTQICEPILFANTQMNKVTVLYREVDARHWRVKKQVRFSEIELAEDAYGCVPRIEQLAPAAEPSENPASEYVPHRRQRGHYMQF